MRQVATLLFSLLLSGCWVHQNITSYQSDEKRKLIKADYQVEFEIVKDIQHRTLPFVFIVKSGKGNNWLINASFRISQKELKAVSMRLSLSDKYGNILFEPNSKTVDLIEYENYNAKSFDFGTFENETTSNSQDTLIAVYEISIPDKLTKEATADTAYLVLIDPAVMC